MNSLKLFDQDLLIRRKCDVLIGTDEAGRGPLAGPVVAAAVILPPNFFHSEINDSKKLSPSKREKIVREIKDQVCFSVVAIPVQKIDEINILQASWQAMRQAVENVLRAQNRKLSQNAPFLYQTSLSTKKILVAVDGWAIQNFNHEQESCIQGDQKSLSIATASLFAKVTRDELMMQLHQTYPQYGFDKHKGYGTALHLARLKEHGVCPEHRRSFAPIKKITSAQNK